MALLANNPSRPLSRVHTLLMVLAAADMCLAPAGPLPSGTAPDASAAYVYQWELAKRLSAIDISEERSVSRARNKAERQRKLVHTDCNRIKGAVAKAIATATAKSKATPKSKSKANTKSKAMKKKHTSTA